MDDWFCEIRNHRSASFPVEKAAVGHESLLSAQRLLNTQHQHRFDHEFKGVDGIDSSANRRFRNRLYGDDERHPVLGHVWLLLQ